MSTGLFWRSRVVAVAAANSRSRSIYQAATINNVTPGGKSAKMKRAEVTIHRCMCIIVSLALIQSARTSGQEVSEDEKHEVDDKKLFVFDLLRHLQEQNPAIATGAPEDNDASSRDGLSQASRRQQLAGAGTSNSMSQLLSAIGADGDAKRLLDWVQGGLNLATVGELTTQFVVGKLASVNCPAILRPDPEEQLLPRFLLFNEQFTDVPFELPPVPSAKECLSRGHFDPKRKTIVLIHGFLSGYTLTDGMTNIKNRLLDLSRFAGEKSMGSLYRAARNNGSYLLTDDIEAKMRSQQFNVIVVDWFRGANPAPRSRYIRSAVNAQVVGKLIARFLAALAEQCRAPPSTIQILAHSLGCHVAGFAGKAMNKLGHQLGRITHLDPIGLCFGRLFSEPHLRLSPNDALETRAVHVSLNLYDNPLDGAHSNFLVNGGRDQIGCGGQSEVKNSTSSSINLLFDSTATFSPCSHLRALALYEDDLSTEAAKCQIVGYRCSSYERFLSGKCGHCDAFNSQCRLMSFSPIDTSFRRIDMPPLAQQQATTAAPPASPYRHKAAQKPRDNRTEVELTGELLDVLRQHGDGGVAWLIEDKELNDKIGATIAKMKPELGQTSDKRPYDGNDLLARRADSLTSRSSLLAQLPVVGAEQRERFIEALNKIRSGTKSALVEGWTALAGANNHLHQMTASPASAEEQGPLQAQETQHVEHPSSPPPAPVGSQKLPPGHVNGPLYFVGTSSLSPYCVNYYQFRVLIAESRIRRLLQNEKLLSALSAGQVPPQVPLPPPSPTTSKHNMLHLTVKLVDSLGRFFKGFSLVENVQELARAAPGSGWARSEPMLEMTLLLNTTRAEPVRISETIISYYQHRIVLADTVEVNYMSNISPEVRARYSSLLCPVAINDQHQLVRYMECDKISAKRRRK